MDFHLDCFLLADPSQDGALDGSLYHARLGALFFFKTEVISVFCGVSLFGVECLCDEFVLRR